MLDSLILRIYTYFIKLSYLLMVDIGLVYKMMRLTFNLNTKGIERYLYVIGDWLRQVDNKVR